MYSIVQVNYTRPSSGTAGVRLAVFNSTLKANFRGHTGVGFIGYARFTLRFKFIRTGRYVV